MIRSQLSELPEKGMQRINRYTLKEEVRDSQYFRKDKFGNATNTLVEIYQSNDRSLYVSIASNRISKPLFKWIFRHNKYFGINKELYTERIKQKTYFQPGKRYVFLKAVEGASEIL
jgi:hypothetical protein